ncbi:MAG: hypothetical protein WC340_03260 [Kiritimatiellia bacterium]
MRMYHHVLLVGFFAMLLFGCLVGSLFHWDFYGQQEEGRRLAEFPDFEKTQLNKWPNAFEAYFSDHFGFRNAFIRRYNHLMHRVGKDHRVIHGAEGWLYFNRNSIMVDYFGDRESSTQKLQDQLRRMKARRDWLRQRGIDYLFIVVPNKITVYPEYLPADLRSLRGKTHREALLEQLGDNLAPNFMDLTPILLKMKNQSPLYLRNDTHWNSLGAYIGYSNIVAELQRRLPNIPNALKINQLTKKNEIYVGDLAKMTGAPNDYQEQIEKLTNSDSADWSSKDLKHPVFLTPKNQSHCGGDPVTVHNPAGTLNAFVFHDSFLLHGAMVDWLPAQFKNTTFIWLYSNAEVLKTIIELCHPDIVIEQVIERSLVDEEYGSLSDDLEIKTQE